MAAGSLTEAISVAKPHMTDTFNEMSSGAVLLGAWAIKGLKWSELQKLPSTKHSLVMKDPDEERGKLMCARGTVIEIQAVKTPQGKIFTGGLFSGAHIIRFIAVGSSGELVARSRTGFCGIVVGKQSYANSVGGSAHAVFLVGMFSLPENKRS